MNWGHVHLIFMREISDQLRDRRTLFTITVLPILLYPLLGMLMMQIAQFKQEHTVRIRVVGAENWPASIPLLTKQQDLAVATVDERMPKLVEFETIPWKSNDPGTSDSDPDARQKQLADLRIAAREAIKNGSIDAVLIVEPEFEQRLEQRLITQIGSQGNLESGEVLAGASVQDVAAAQAKPTAESLEDPGLKKSDSTPGPLGDGLHLVANLARDHSTLANRRLDTILRQWKEDWTASKLEAAGLNPQLVQPLRMSQTDTAVKSVKRAMLWSKVLPFVMLVWALTGAFYPAIDLCAGEKERGTLETLLSSPARRCEIVWGKLLTISAFSMGSALLNLMSMHLTASMLVRQLASQGGTQIAEALGPMPFHALGWLVLLLIPMAAFFSALSLAVAALARSTKEGQYYLMPLLLVTLPLVALPMIPSLELNLGTSLVPVSGAVFLVRTLIEGRYTEALIHLPIVMLVTATCCALSIRWAIRQFESESVMFRESERWNMRLWVRQLWRDRGETASPTEAVMCGVIIMMAMFFAQMVVGGLETWADFARSTAIVQIGIILTPALLMAIFLTRSIRRALRVHRVQPAHLAAAVVLGVALHPSYTVLSAGIGSLYAVGDETQAVLRSFSALVTAQPLWAVLLILAVLPAICEEITFRGFIFGGLLRQGGALRAIVVSALFFGFMHSVLQQSLSACLMGLVLGFVAWRTGGVICTMIVHVINNTLTLTMAWCAARSIDVAPPLQWAIISEDTGWAYSLEWITISVALTAALMVVLFRRDSSTKAVVKAEMV